MTVQELIEKLKKQSPNNTVKTKLYSDDDFRDIRHVDTQIIDDDEYRIGTPDSIVYIEYF